MEDNKFLNKNTAINRAPDQAAINDVTGYVENGAVEKTFNFKRSFIKLFIGVRNFEFVKERGDTFSVNYRIILISGIS